MNHKISLFSLASLLLASSLTGCMYPELEDDLAAETSGGENSSSKEKFLPSAEITQSKISKDGYRSVIYAEAKIQPNEAYEQEEIGFCYATHENPTIQDKVSSITREEDPDIVNGRYINDNLDDIDPGQTYYVRAYARNGAGTAYSSSQSVEVPNLDINAPTLTRANTGKQTYKLTGSYRPSYSTYFKNTVMGLCRTVDDSSTKEYQTEVEPTGADNYVVELSVGKDLVEGHNYTYYLYFKSGDQYVYSDPVMIYLDKEHLIPSIKITNCNIKTTTESGMWYQVIYAEANVKPNESYDHEELGFCYATHPDPTTEDLCNIITASENPDIIKWTAIKSELADIVPGQTYYVRAYARNRAGITFSAEQLTVETPDLKISNPQLKLTTTDDQTYTFTGSYYGSSYYNSTYYKNTMMGLCYTIDDSMDKVYLTETNLTWKNYVETLTIGETLKVGHNYTFYLYFKSGEQYVYTDPVMIYLDEAHRGYKTHPDAPDATLTSIGEGTARGYFTVSARGSAKSSDYALESYGLCWSKKSLPTTSDDNWTEESNSSSATISQRLEDNFEPNTTYYFRAFGTNGVGTGYSSEKKLDTPDDDAKPKEDLNLSDYNSNVKIISYFEGTTYKQNECGVCYSATNILPAVGGEDVTSVVAEYAESSSQYFSTVLQKGTDLTKGQSYYFRAYIKTSHGYVYSNAKKHTVN